MGCREKDDSVLRTREHGAPQGWEEGFLGASEFVTRDHWAMMDFCGCTSRGVQTTRDRVKIVGASVSLVCSEPGWSSVGPRSRPDLFVPGSLRRGLKLSSMRWCRAMSKVSDPGSLDG